MQWILSKFITTVCESLSNIQRRHHWSGLDCLPAQGAERWAVLSKRQSKAAETHTVYTGCTAYTFFWDIRDWMCCGNGEPMSRAGFCRMAQLESDTEETYFANMPGCDKSGHGSP